MSPGERIRDDLLVLQCQHGDRRALGELVSRWQGPLVRYASRLLGDHEAALDAVQETWMAAVRGIVGLRDVARFKPWVYGILSRKCADYWRRKGSRAEVSAEAAEAMRGAGELAAAPSADADREVGLERAFGRLSADERTLLALRYMEDFGVAEIGDILGVPEGTVKSRLFHAREHLRQVMER